MAAFPSWVGDNWFNVVQTAGIIGSLLMATAAANREARAKETENILALSEHHRNLWIVIAQRPEFPNVILPFATAAMLWTFCRSLFSKSASRNFATVI